MSVFTDMKEFMLQKKMNSSSKTGAKKDEWINVEMINVAVYKIDAYKQISNADYEKSTHNGITLYNEFSKKEKYRIINENNSYNITFFNEDGRHTVLLLESVVLYE